MTTRYYFSWFNEGFPEKLVDLLHEDIADRKSLVMINGQPANFDYQEINLVKDRWLTPAGIVFDDYHMVDYRMTKEEAHGLLEKASVIFICGGVTVSLNAFLIDYQLSEVIKKSSAIVMGASAGAINMSRQWLCSQSTGNDVESSSICDGIGLDDFFFCAKPNLEIGETALLDELLPFSQTIDCYVAVNECAIRIKDDNRTIMGEVYLVSHGEIQKLVESI